MLHASHSFSLRTSVKLHVWLREKGLHPFCGRLCSTNVQTAFAMLDVCGHHEVTTVTTGDHMSYCQ